MSTPVYDWIAHHAAARGHRPATLDLATGRRLTYRALHERISRLAAGLRARYGVSRGDRVAVLAHNSTDLYEIQFACNRLAAIFAPLNWRLAVPELRFILGDSRPVVLIYDPEFEEAAGELAASCEIRGLCSRDPADSVYERLIADSMPLTQSEPVTHEDVATILYTSGTTGHPKGAIITHGMRFWQAINLTGPSRLGAESVCLNVFPQFHVGGLDVFANPIFHYGGQVIMMRAYDPALTLRLLSDPDAGVTHFIGAPAHFLFMSQPPDFHTATFHPRLLAYVAASPVPAAQIRQWEERGLHLLQGYGMTETCGVVTILDPEDATRKAGSAGKPCLHFECRVVDANGSDVEPGAMGELWAKGPSVIPGYWNNPEANRSAFTDGWLHTGDAVTVDEEGFFYIVDRWKDMYISGGENVYPAEVEAVLFQLAGIAEAAVIGVPDERWGEVGRAIVALRPGAEITEADIMRHCDENLARYKQPRSIRFVEALPRNATGKVHKPTLRREYGAP